MGFGNRVFYIYFFFWEYIYVFVYDYGLNRLNRNCYIFLENVDYDKKYSLLIMKCLIL